MHSYFQKHENNRDPVTMEKLRKLWTCGRFGSKDIARLAVKPAKVRPDVGMPVRDLGMCPTLVPAKEIICDMLTDSGNGTFFPEQKKIIADYEKCVESNDMNQYAKSSTRQHLDEII